MNSIAEHPEQAAALSAAATLSEQKNAPDALHRGEGDDQNPNNQDGYRS